MQGYNLIVVFGPDERTLLMCRRRRDPYKGLLNFVGGKIEPGEDGLDAACNSRQEETGIARGTSGTYSSASRFTAAGRSYKRMSGAV